MNLSDSAAPRAPHRWKFFRAGGVDQVTLDKNSDLAALKDLDQKLWVALSCPTHDLEFDSKTLDLLDTDHDGHVRAPEIIAAVNWIVEVLEDPVEILQGSETLPLSSIRAASPEGAQLLAAAQQVLASLGKPDATAISLADTTDTAAIFAKTKFNGDGVIPPDSVDDAAARAVIADIIACVGGEMDRSGVPGVTQARLDQFSAELQAFSDWRRKAEDDPATILPLGDATAEAYEAVKSVRSKVDDYFARCRLAAFDSRAAAALNRAESEYQAIAARELSPSGGEMSGFPLSRIDPDRPLPLLAGVNPAWASALVKLYRHVVVPLIAPATPRLTPDDWAKINEKFVPYEAWLAARAGAPVEKLGLARVREILAGDSRALLADAIARDKSLEATMNEIVVVDRLVRYHRDLIVLLRNFVSFRDFYSGRRKAIFQVGTLYLDGRSCDLCVRVDDPAKHAALAGLSETYLAYCECTRKDVPEKLQIAAAFTGGDSDNLMVGRNGIFYDRQGRDWDATITKIIEKPISIWQAILSPYKRIGRLIGDQIQKAAAAREQAAQQQAAAAAAQPGAPAAAAPAKPPVDVGRMVGILAAVGIALSGISTLVMGILMAFFNLKWWEMPLAMLGILTVISGASMILAALQLRKRNLGPILDANGWAVNGRVKINIPFGAALTKTARLPKGSIRMLKDPYAAASKTTKIALWVMILALVAAAVTSYILWTNGTINRWFHRPEPQHKAAPAGAPPAPTAPSLAPTEHQAAPRPVSTAGA
ncbi:MAG: hypothetical protein ACLQVA_09490 [Candidatus Brocadiia bacterium]